MGSLIRNLLVCILALFLPAALAVYVSPMLFPSAPSSAVVSSRSVSLHPISKESSEAKASVETFEESLLDGDRLSYYVSISHDSALDPTANETFVVSVKLKIDNLPKLSKREKVIYKYDIATRPYAGWALAFHRLSTSLRPEIYWRDSSGNGGWYTFNEVHLDSRQWYRFYIFARAKEFISLYMEASTGEGRGSKLHADTDLKSVNTVFLGGYEVDEVSIPASSGDLYLRSTNGRGGSFKARISEVLIASTERLPGSDSEAREMILKGVGTFVDYLGPDNLELWLDSKGKDLSSRKRLVKSRG